MKLMKRYISIVVPVYNAENTLKECLDSLIGQTYEKKRIILIDDGSTDNSGTICDQYALKYSCVKVFHQKNKGVSAARNLGISKTNTEYITFVDSDDYVEKDFLIELLEGFKHNVQLSVCGYTKNTVAVHYHKNILGKIQVDKLLDTLFNNNGPQGYLWNKLFETQIIKENDLSLDENLKMAEDMLFLVEYSLNCKDVFVFNNTEYNYVQKSTGLSEKIDDRDNFYPSFEDFLYVSNKIRKLVIKDYPRLNKNYSAHVALVCGSFIRRILMKNKLSYNDKKKIKKLQKIGLSNQRSMIENSYPSFIQRVLFFVTVYLPYLLRTTMKVYE